MSGLEISSFVHLGWKKGKRAEARFLFLQTPLIHFIPEQFSKILSKPDKRKWMRSIVIQNEDTRRNG